MGARFEIVEWFAGIRRSGSRGAVGHSDEGARHAPLTMGRSFPATDRYSVGKMHVCLLLIIPLHCRSGSVVRCRAIYHAIYGGMA